MKKTTLLFAASILLVPAGLTAQSLSPEVIGAQGDFFSTVSVNLSCTLGEPMTETYSGALNQLTQGFHQPDRNAVQGFDDTGKKFNLSLYPNPTHGNLTLIFESSSETHHVWISDAAGRLIAIYEVYSNVSNEISLGDIERGIYMLQLVHESGTVRATSKFVKL